VQGGSGSLPDALGTVPNPSGSVQSGLCSVQNAFCTVQSPFCNEQNPFNPLKMSYLDKFAVDRKRFSSIQSRVFEQSWERYSLSLGESSPVGYYTTADSFE